MGFRVSERGLEGWKESPQGMRGLRQGRPEAGKEQGDQCGLGGGKQPEKHSLGAGKVLVCAETDVSSREWGQGSAEG